MPWWAWLVLGAAMLGLEVAISTEFWLALVGAAAMTLGLLLTFGIVPPVTVQWIAFAVLAVAYNVFFRRRIHEKLGGTAPGLAPELEGESGTALEAIAPGATGPIELRGSTWRARNTGDTTVAARASVRVVGKEGILLEVRG
jgi:membrane protein implicated in regulation of membrane protease activity